VVSPQIADSAESTQDAQTALEAHILGVVAQAIARGAFAGEVPASVRLERPKNRDHGDYATSIALQLAKAAGITPQEVAKIIAADLTALDEITSVAIAGPGFINITLNRASQAELVRNILIAGEKYGHGNSLTGVSINLEFISANPTGPLHLGHTRWAAVGDALGRVLSAAGAKVTQEFYINDRGNQMDLFGASVEAAALGLPIEHWQYWKAIKIQRSHFLHGHHFPIPIIHLIAQRLGMRCMTRQKCIYPNTERLI
jgi:arginyl-tRNA synthetase